jgi:SAM-dependent methyltransferase
MEDQDNRNPWTEDLSSQFIQYGRYFVPEREHQMRLLAGLLADFPPSANVLELCCGEGYLAEMLLEAYPGYAVLAYDGSPIMLEKARGRLRRFGERAHCLPFDLAAQDWRQGHAGVSGVVSMLAIHHLLAPQKQALFRDVYRLLLPGGVFAVADVCEVSGACARRLAADEWDWVVQARSFELDGSSQAFDFFRREGWNMHRYLDPDDIDKPSPLLDQLKWLEAAGFSEVGVHWMLAGHAVFSAKKL